MVPSGEAQKKGSENSPISPPLDPHLVCPINWPKLVELIASWAIDTEPTRARGVIIVGYSWPSF